jgi:hypothetical protein
MTEIIVRWGPWAILAIVVAVIVLLVIGLCKISTESDAAMDKAVGERWPDVRRVEEIMLPGGGGWIKNPTLKRESRRRFEDVEADDAD